jgi:hypothetical protein
MIQESVTKLRLRVIEAVATFPAIPGLVFALFVLLGEGPLFNPIMIWLLTSGGLAVVGAVCVTSVLRARDNALSVNRIDVLLVGSYGFGWVLFVGSYLAAGSTAPSWDPLELLFVLGMSTPAIAAGLLSLVVLGRFSIMIFNTILGISYDSR